MAEAALVLSIKFAQTPSDTFYLSSLPAAKPSLFMPAQRVAESAHTVLPSAFPSVHLLQVIKVIKCTVHIFLTKRVKLV